MNGKADELAVECRRLEEGCLYTSTTLFIWLRMRRRVRAGFILLALVLGSVAGFVAKNDASSARLAASICSFLAGLLPAVYAALKWDQELEGITASAATFKNLQDRFRQAALLSSRKPFAEFEKDFNALMHRLEEARAESVTPPEWCFKAAQKKVQAGDYTYDLDIARDKEKREAEREPTTPEGGAPGER